MVLASLKVGLGGLLSTLGYRVEVLRRLGGVAPRECPICGYKGRFRAFGHPPRYDAECPNCTSLERHRLLHLALQAHGILFPSAEALHFAPEQALIPIVKSRVGRYVTADLEDGFGDLSLDLERIALPDACFDIVIANHVLEHVDDRAALLELRRILRSNGVLVVTVPLVEGWDTTYENPSIATPRDRDLHFGQGDHIRYYGRDFRQRVSESGLILSEYSASGPDTALYGLLRGERVFLARKR